MDIFEYWMENCYNYISVRTNDIEELLIGLLIGYSVCEVSDIK